MLQRLAALPYRTRLVLAMALVAVLPVAFLGLVVIGAGADLRGRQDATLASAAQLASAYLGGGRRVLDEASANEVAAITGLVVTLYGPDGTVLATSSGTGTASAPLPSERPAGGHALVRRSRADVSAVSVVTDQAGAAAGYVAVTERDVGALGLGLDLAAVIVVALGFAVVAALVLTYYFTRGLLRPLRTMAAAVARLQAGDLEARLPAQGDDELAALATSHNRLADTLAARNRSLTLVLGAIAQLAPSDGVAALLDAAPEAARRAFGFTAVTVELGDPVAAAGDLIEERIPGEAWSLRTPLLAGDERVGTLVTTLAPTRDWAQADADLLGIFASELGAAIRNAQLFAQVEELSETKSEFLRGVTHNLQTPLTSIRAFAGQLAEEYRRGRGSRPPSLEAPRVSADPRLEIIVEQSERLSRLVDQLLTVSRLEAGTLRPEVEVFAPAPLVRRAWESLGRDGHPFELRDRSAGWLATADRDRVDQVVWALLDNALKHGGPGAIEVEIRTGSAGDPLPSGDWLVVSVRDHGPGIPPADHERVFERFTRLMAGGGGDGTGLGLSVARGLVEAMGGRLWIADPDGPGAVFAFSLPAEPIEES